MFIGALTVALPLDAGAEPAEGLGVGSLPHSFTDAVGAAPASLATPEAAAEAAPEGAAAADADDAGTMTRGSSSALAVGIALTVGAMAALSLAVGAALVALAAPPRLRNPDPPSTAPPASAAATAKSSTHPGMPRRGGGVPLGIDGLEFDCAIEGGVTPVGGVTEPRVAGGAGGCKGTPPGRIAWIVEF